MTKKIFLDVAMSGLVMLVVVLALIFLSDLPAGWGVMMVMMAIGASVLGGIFRGMFPGRRRAGPPPARAPWAK